jgi:hypothetical protein
MEKPTYTPNMGRGPPWEGPRPNHQPTWQRRWLGEPARVRPHRGCARTLGGEAQAHLPMAVASHHAKAVLAGFLIFLRQTDLDALYKKRRSSYLTHTTFGATHLTTLLL